MQKEPDINYSEKFSQRSTEVLKKCLDVSNIPLDSEIGIAMAKVNSLVKPPNSMEELKNFNIGFTDFESMLSNPVEAKNIIVNLFKDTQLEEAGKKFEVFCRMLRGWIITFQEAAQLPSDMKIYLLHQFKITLLNRAFIVSLPRLTEEANIIAKKIEELIQEEYKKIEAEDSPERIIYFQCRLSKKQETTLVKELKQQHYTNAPQKIIDFLKGSNDINATINETKLHHISYLLFRIYNSQSHVLKLNFGKGYYAHFQNYIAPFCTEKEKWKMKELKRQVVTKKYNKSSVKADVDAIIAKLGIL
jgi:hypothetical protein